MIQKNVLLVGITFTPTLEKSNKLEPDDDLNELFRKLRLQEYFDDISLVKKSNITPSDGSNLNLETYQQPTSCMLIYLSQIEQ